jgi:predicted small secreted protein
LSSFKKISSSDNIKEVIKSSFDKDLDISGAWGYSQDEAIVIEKKQASLKQFEHMLIMMRSYIEMNMTIAKEDRYAGINATELARQTVKDDSLTFDKVTYKISAIKELEYNEFIKEYKENSEKDGFDLGEHFKRRENATLNREVICWFDVTKMI